MNTESFVYIWTNKITNKFYIGKHKGHPNDGYISSGKHFLQAYHLEPYNFERQLPFFGSDSECLREESRLIAEAISTIGYAGIYNLTHWADLKTWKRTCTHCGSIVDPRNEEWAIAFEEYHFFNCAKRLTKPVVIIKPVIKTNSTKKLTRKQRLAQRALKE